MKHSAARKPRAAGQARATQQTEREAGPQKAIIYCRVSSKNQTIDGAGLESQEHRCRLYADERGYEVEAVFPDGVSGGGDFMNRPGMVALLAYLDARKEEDFVIIFDDLKRFARDIEFHKKLRQTLYARGARPECLNFRFEDTPEGEFIETIIAAQGELERKQNRRQVLQKMKARVEQGFWVFHTLPGYRYTKGQGGGKVLVRDEPLASIMTEALEGFASGRFGTQAEVRRFLEARPEFPRPASMKGLIRNQRVTDLLTHPLYAGCVLAPSWGVSLREGKHDGLISYQTFQKIQARIKGAAVAPARANIGETFALRGFVLCGDCETPLYSCESTGRMGKRYPYYLCQTKGCASYGKSIRRDDLEGAFEALLRTLRPSAALFQTARKMFGHAWEQRSAQKKAMQASLRRQAQALEAQIDRFMDVIAGAPSGPALAAYGRKIEALEAERILTHERLAETNTDSRHLSREAREKLETALAFLANPWKLWEKGDQTLRRTVLKLVFAERLAYDRKTGPRTPKTTLPFKALGGLGKGKEKNGAAERT